MKRFLSIFLCSLLILAVLPAGSGLAEEHSHDVELWNVVKPLETTVTFLNTGAHPDDERSDFLAYLSRGLGVKTSSLIANRGEGGQNEIGTELGNALGIIRSREMIEAAKITGVKAYHLSETTSDAIYDFGFSKTPEETLDKWGEEETYEGLIRFIREYQPDIVMPSFRNVDSQHGHHRAITILTEKAFQDAANPEVFPEHLRQGLSVWQIKKLYLPAASPEKATTSIEIGDFDPIYNMTYPQLGEESRYMHKSQGMGSDIPAAPRKTHLELVYSSSKDGQEEDGLFNGIPYDFSEWAEVLAEESSDLSGHLAQLQASLDEVVSAYPKRESVYENSQKALKLTKQIIRKVDHSKLSRDMKNELRHKLAVKEEQLQLANVTAASLDIKVTPSTYVLTKGEKASVTVHVKNNGSQFLKRAVIKLVVPQGWKVTGKTNYGHMKPGVGIEASFEVEVTEEAELYHAYDDAALAVQVSYMEAGVEIGHVEELEGTVAVLPEVSMKMNPEDLVVNTADVQKEIPVMVKVKNYRNGATDAVVSLSVPEGWTSTPEKVEVGFHKQLEEKEVAFKLIPPSKVEAGDFSIEAEAEVDGEVLHSTIQEISYDHIGTFYYEYPAKVNGVAFELNFDENLKVGYIDSEFDQVADYLANAGLKITKLSDEDLASGDLNQYDTIVTGIRAYLSREALVQNNDRLHQYVEDGGHLVVQYHKPGDGWNAETTAPYPLKIGTPSIRWRVTDEDAKVTVLQPDSPLFNYPNKITDSDWSGWIQERGLYYPMNWDEQYETFVRMADPNEEPFDGGILMAKYGKGTYLYTNLVFYRQIQGQVPGGYRIFTNLISQKQE